VKVSALIENFATCEQRRNQYDLADYLIEQQQEINQSNEFIDDYNTKLGAVLSEQSLFAELETILDEQKAILMDSGNLSEDEAEGQITRKENLRNIVLSL
jgi:hypothetical protein